MALGLDSGTVRVVRYNPTWPTLFVAEVQRLREALPSHLPIALEHTGSTAVPGLAAKPVLDLLGGYPHGTLVEPYIAALVRSGYSYRGEQGIPGRHFFRRGEPRAYHVHLVEQDGTFWREHIAFRDALRADVELRDEYAALKLNLARRYPRDREAYIEGKTAFVQRVLAATLTEKR
jgi:GrpB-like predicted nucleotidyltransferase (UPF0157 family)